jgi:hypothetical protein
MIDNYSVAVTAESKWIVVDKVDYTDMMKHSDDPENVIPRAVGNIEFLLFAQAENFAAALNLGANS